MTHPLTPEQTAIVITARTGADTVIIAGAGAGKTSTLVAVATDTLTTRPRARILYIAYNKAIQVEAASRFPRNTTCKTAHGLAYGPVGRHYAHRLNGRRVTNAQTALILGIRDMQIDGVDFGRKQLAGLVNQTIARFCYSADTLIVAAHVPFVHGLTRGGYNDLAARVAAHAQRAWTQHIVPLDGQLKFTHDCYLKIWALSGPVLRYDAILFDEAQDANGCVAGIVAAQRAQKIYVGDPNQAIYGWRGAIDALSKVPGTRLTLSKSFRFGPAIAVEANRWLELLDAELRIEGHEPVGSTVGEVDQPDAILCRSNAGTLSAVAGQLAAGRTVALVGGGTDLRSFAEGAAELIERGRTEHPDLFAFRAWPEVLDYVEKDASGADIKPMVKLVDEYGPDGILDLLNQLVDERHADVTVSTAHKAKGREWDRVLIAGDFPVPKCLTVDDDAVTIGEAEAGPSREDMMLAYVTVTRAKKCLDLGGLSWILDLVPDAPAQTTPDAPAAPDPVSEVPARVDGPYSGIAAAVMALPAADAPNPDHCYRCGRARRGGCTCDPITASRWAASTNLPAGPITDPVTPAPSGCETAGCDTPGVLLRCQLCPLSPTYWRRERAGVS